MRRARGGKSCSAQRKKSANRKSGVLGGLSTPLFHLFFAPRGIGGCQDFPTSARDRHSSSAFGPAFDIKWCDSPAASWRLCASARAGGAALKKTTAMTVARRATTRRASARAAETRSGRETGPEATQPGTSVGQGGLRGARPNSRVGSQAVGGGGTPVLEPNTFGPPSQVRARTSQTAPLARCYLRAHRSSRLRGGATQALPRA